MEDKIFRKDIQNHPIAIIQDVVPVVGRAAAHCRVTDKISILGQQGLTGSTDGGWLSEILVPDKSGKVTFRADTLAGSRRMSRPGMREVLSSLTQPPLVSAEL